MPPSLELTAEVTGLDGRRFRWGPNEIAANRVRNLSFSTKIGEGFSSAQGQLARRIDLDYPDINLVDTVTFVGVDGSVAWEGRVSALPRELSDTHSIGVMLTGWMAHAKDRKCREIYVDRETGSWTGQSRSRRANQLTNNFSPFDAQQTIDPISQTAGLTLTFDGSWVSPFKPVAEGWYDAGSDLTVAKIAYTFQERAPVSAADPQWTWAVYVSDNDAATGGLTSTGNIKAAGPVSGTYAPTVGRRYAFLQFYGGTTPSGTTGAQYALDWYNLAVYGSHGLTTYTGEPGQPPGVRASDVIRDIATRFCPRLDPSGVQYTDMVIQHLAFRDRVFPYDAFLEINKYHLWNLAVWENRKLCFAPYDLTDYDWEIRTDDQGTTFSPQGPSVDDLAGGIVVTYTDALTGTKVSLTPEGFPSDLLDSNPDNPWTAHGVENWAEIELSTPTIQAQALQLGRAALIDRNTPKTPGTITVRGYIRDRQGNEQPVWKVRAGDTISITNFPNDTPRLIVETNYDDENKTVSLSIDRPFALLDAYLDRAQNALTARGLA